MQEIKSGDSVWLKTANKDNIEMSAKTKDTKGNWICTWFIKGGLVKEHTFTESQLSLSNPNQKPNIPHSITVRDMRDNSIKTIDD